MKDIYSLESYQFALPEELIAQYPVKPRDSSRLLVLNRDKGTMEDRIFSDILEYVQPGDTLVLNDTRVIPARLYGVKESGARVEILLLKDLGGVWEALVRPARRLKPGERVRFEVPATGLNLAGSKQVELEIMAELDIPGGRRVAFCNCNDEMAFIEMMGQMPLPPYIKRQAEIADQESYQTVYAQQSGSAAAPTAGLHFTSDLLEVIRSKGVNIAKVLLHVGLGTFHPVSNEDIRQHQIHEEYCKLDEDTARILNLTREQGHRIIAVGTTVVRTLESFYDDGKGFQAGAGETRRFIYPGYDFKAVDAMLTNYHLPGSSLIMLVAAFAGYDRTMEAYQHAIDLRYRFFSFGDAMLIL